MFLTFNKLNKQQFHNDALFVLDIDIRACEWLRLLAVPLYSMFRDVFVQAVVPSSCLVL